MPNAAEKIKEIEAEMARTQKNKATEHHLGLLKAKISKLRAEMMAPSKTGGKGEGFDVVKTGNATVVLIGFPSVGKSTFLNKVCGTKSAEAAHEFTTLTCVPGIYKYHDAKIQLLDLPGIIEGASKGKGRGKQVIAVARGADLVVMMVDAVKGDIQKKLLTKELEDCHIRLNQKPADVYFKRKKAGGLKINATLPLTKINDRLIRGILSQYKIHHCDLLIREDVTVDQLIDTIEGNRMYIPCLYLYNKIDNLTIEELDEIASEYDNCLCSVKANLNMPFVLERIWDKLAMIRIYTKPKGGAPDLTEPVILPKDSTMQTICDSIHRDFSKKFRYGLVWGRSAKHRRQNVGLKHRLMDEDVVQIVTNEN